MILTELQNKRILVAGGGGFLGRHVVWSLLSHGVQENNIIISHSKTHDLRDPAATRQLIAGSKPDMVICLAARLSGIGDNIARPAQYMLDNLQIGLNLIEESRKASVRKFVYIGTVCSYPRDISTPFTEENFWDGYPEPSNAPYGIAKKAIGAYLQAAHLQYGFNSVQLILTNLYGPHDDFRDRTSHVIPALIKKVVKATINKDQYLTAWGDGSPTRDFLYVSDAAEGIVRAAAQHNDPAPVNVGSGMEVSIRALLSAITEIVGYTGGIRWDDAKPNGQPRRVLDITKARMLFGFAPQVSLMNGLKETIAWYMAHRDEIDALPDKYPD